jgi:hypothetical protein
MLSITWAYKEPKRIKIFTKRKQTYKRFYESLENQKLTTVITGKFIFLTV